jgi:hypothetical protein
MIMENTVYNNTLLFEQCKCLYPVFHVRRTLGGISNCMSNWVSKWAGHRRAPGEINGAAYSFRNLLIYVKCSYLILSSLLA